MELVWLTLHSHKADNVIFKKETLYVFLLKMHQKMGQMANLRIAQGDSTQTAHLSLKCIPSLSISEKI